MKPYCDYKTSALPRIPKIPSHWRMVRAKFQLKEIDVRSLTGDEELLSVSHITGVTRRSDKNVTMFESESYEGSKLCWPDDLVINTMWAWMGALGVSGLHGIVSPSYAVYRQRNPQEFNPKYLHYLSRLSLYVAEYNCRSTGVNDSRLRLYPDRFLNIPLICPPRAEQDAIVLFLEAKERDIAAFIANKRRTIELLKEHKTALINRAVTHGLNPKVKLKASGIPWLGEIPEHWKTLSIGQMSEMLQTGPFGSQLHSHEYVSGGIPIINPSHMRAGRVTPDSDCAVSKTKWQELSRHAVQLGDIVFARRGELGRCALIAENEIGWLCGTGSLIMRPKMGVTLDNYLITALCLPGVAEYLTKQSVGSTMDNLNTAILANQRLTITPIEEHRKIVENLSAYNSEFDHLGGYAEREIALMEEYRTALISDAVTGKIDVRP